MKRPEEAGTHEAWARFKFSVVGPLLSSPPAEGELRAELRRLASTWWQHPITGERRRFAFSSIERWYYLAKKTNDPMGALRRQVRKDCGKQDVNALLIEHLKQQYHCHPGWSYRLHVDNVAVLVEEDEKIGPMRSYPTLLRCMKSHGWMRVRGRRRKGAPGAERADRRRAQFETRSFEVEYVHGLWHFDFHHGSRKVLTREGQWKTPKLLGFLDDHSRLCCHLQWYLEETAAVLVHGVSQALQKRGLPRAIMGDQGSANRSEEFQEGLSELSIEWDPTAGYSPEQNGKKEVFWAQVEGRLMAMLEGVEPLTLDLLNEATQAWSELEYNRERHDETGETPLDRFLRNRSVGRDCPASEVLRRAFRVKATRRQRRSDGTLVVLGQRFEIPSRYRHRERLCVRYARWDLSVVELWDERSNRPLCALSPLDKAKNAAGIRRRKEDVTDAALDEAAARPREMAPLLRKLMAEYAETGLPPAYLPRDDREGDGAAKKEEVLP